MKTHPTPTQVWLVCIALALAIVAVYAQVHEFDYVNYDDAMMVYENPYVADGLTWDNFIWSFGLEGPAHWHPMAWWVHQLIAEWFGLDPGGYHLVNVVLHTAATLAMLFAFWRLTRKFWPSALVAGLFAVHPLSVESVAWISHMRDPLSMLFWALVMWAYASYVRVADQSTPPITIKARSYALVITLFALGLMAKPVLITIPCVLLLLDYWPLNRVTLDKFKLPEIRVLILEKIPLFVLAAVSISLSLLRHNNTDTTAPLETIPLLARLVNAAQSYVLYLYKMIWPTGLSIVYPVPEPFHPAGVGAAITILLALTAAAIVFGLRKKYLLVGWLWYVGSLAPVIGILAVGHLRVMEDHNAYVSLLGIYLIIAFGLSELVNRFTRLRIPVLSASCLMLIVLALTAREQVGVWRNSTTLWTHAASHTESNTFAYVKLGDTHQEQNQYEKAAEQYQQALRIDADYAIAHSGMGYVFLFRNNLDQAGFHFEHALRVKPHYTFAHMLGNIRSSQQQYAEAVSYYQQTLELAPNTESAANALAWILATCPDPSVRSAAEAIEHAMHAVRLTRGRNPIYLATLAAAYAEARRFSEAIEASQHALTIAEYHGDRKLEQLNRERIILYQEGKAYRQP